MEAASLPTPAGLAGARGGRLLRLRSDDQLVALFRLGNDEAFRVIHDRYRARLFAYTRQMLSGSAADAEDTLQDVFLRAYGALRADERPVTLRAWLYRVAHNRCVDHMRRPANQPTGELFEQLSSLADPLADIQRRDDLRRLVEDVRALPEQQRSALLMREMEGLSYLELADALGVTIPSIKSLLVRARIGLTEAREARDTACVEIRADLAGSHDRGVRSSGRARRHLKGCSGCTEYRGRLRGARAGFAALGGSPTGWAAVAKLIGLGGAGAGSSGVAVGGTLAAGGTAKVAAIVCCAAVVGGGAVEASRELVRRDAPATARSAAPRGAALPPARAAAPTRVPGDPFAARAAARGRPAAPAAADGRASATRTEARADRFRIPGLPLLPPPLAVPETVTLGGPSPDEDALVSAASGGALAPAEEPEPLAPVEPVTEQPLVAPPLAADPRPEPLGPAGP